ncbi:hypothetical protein J3F84DRAFT_381267 [Trichoderma pleuroticola]
MPQDRIRCIRHETFDEYIQTVPETRAIASRKGMSRTCAEMQALVGFVGTRTSLRFVVQAATRVPGLVTSITMTFCCCFFLPFLFAVCPPSSFVSVASCRR